MPDSQTGASRANLIRRDVQLAVIRAGQDTRTQQYPRPQIEDPDQCEQRGYRRHGRKTERVDRFPSTDTRIKSVDVRNSTLIKKPSIPRCLHNLL